MLLWTLLLLCAIPSSVLGDLLEESLDADSDLADFDLDIVRCLKKLWHILEFGPFFPRIFFLPCSHRHRAGSLDR